MNRTLETQAALDRAVAELQRQVDVDPELVISELDDDGRVQIEGTVQLVDVVMAAADIASNGTGWDSGAGHFGGIADEPPVIIPGWRPGTVTDGGNIRLFDGCEASSGIIGLHPDAREAAEAAGWEVTAQSGGHGLVAHRERGK